MFRINVPPCHTTEFAHHDLTLAFRILFPELWENLYVECVKSNWVVGPSFSLFLVVLVCFLEMEKAQLQPIKSKVNALNHMVAESCRPAKTSTRCLCND